MEDKLLYTPENIKERSRDVNYYITYHVGARRWIAHLINFENIYTVSVWNEGVFYPLLDDTHLLAGRMNDV